MRVELITFAPYVDGITSGLPLVGRVCRYLKALDRDEYWVVELDDTARVSCPDLGKVRYLLYWPDVLHHREYSSGTLIKTGVDVVTDESLLADDYIDFGKCRPVGVGRIQLVQA